MPDPRKEIARKYLEKVAEAEPEHVSLNWGSSGKKVEFSIEVEDGAFRENVEENAKHLMICIVKEHKRLERRVDQKLDICDIIFEPLERGTYQVHSVVKPRQN